jgi:hypothetical protein
VLTPLLPAFYENQMGTLHFRYLRSVAGGLITVAESIDEHLAQLDAALGSPPGTSIPASPFVREFVRPLGLTTTATAVFVEAVEGMRSLKPGPAPSSAASRLWRAGLIGIRAAERRVWLERWFLSAREHGSVVALRAAAAVKQAQNLSVERAREAQKAFRTAARRTGKADKAARAADHERGKQQLAEEKRAAKRRAERRQRLRHGWHVVSRRVFGAARAPEER